MCFVWWFMISLYLYNVIDVLMGGHCQMNVAMAVVRWLSWWLRKFIDMHRDGIPHHIIHGICIKVLMLKNLEE